MSDPISRRAFGKAMAGSSLVAGLSTMAGRWVTADEIPLDIAAELPKFEGEFFVDPLTRNEYARDYGQIVHSLPAAVLRPGSVQDIVRAVRFARRCRLKIATRGHGHQPFGQAQVAGGIVIDMRSLNRVHALSRDEIEVDAGIAWREVIRAASSQGRTPPVFTNYLGLTVGGTLSIGGVGVATARHGAQVDQVTALQVVSGEGEALDCSTTARRDLFDAVLAGQGQCAVITGATLKLRGAPDMIREYMLPYSDLQTLLRDGAVLAKDGRFDGFVALLAPVSGGWTYVLSAIRYCTRGNASNDAALLSGLHFQPSAAEIRDRSFLDYADVAPPFDPALAHADLGVCLPNSALASWFADVQPRLTDSDLGAAAAMRVFFWKRDRFTRPLLRIPDEECFSYIAILRSQTSDGDTLARQLSGNRELFELTRDRGGTLYPFAALVMQRSDWRRHYGPHWRGLMTMKRRYDPDGVFASGPNLNARVRSARTVEQAD